MTIGTDDVSRKSGGRAGIGDQVSLGSGPHQAVAIPNPMCCRRLDPDDPAVGHGADQGDAEAYQQMSLRPTYAPKTKTVRADVDLSTHRRDLVRVRRSTQTNALPILSITISL
ncbi:hypothetical protein L3i22_023630 [Actinoplanes sp. L3-i22]|nr:hypothetical protein L3i22_023630 [Actinoplanes sp. L3-i22]